jgi:hypothetical protein
LDDETWQDVTEDEMIVHADVVVVVDSTCDETDDDANKNLNAVVAIYKE